LAVATLSGIREFNVEVAQTFRKRRADAADSKSKSSSMFSSDSVPQPPELLFNFANYQKLIDDDMNSWEVVLHRFAAEEHSTLLENMWDDEHTSSIISSSSGGSTASIVFNGSNDHSILNERSSVRAAPIFNPSSSVSSNSSSSALPPATSPGWLSQLRFFDQVVYPVPMSRLSYILYRAPLSFVRRCQPSAPSLLTKYDLFYASLMNRSSPLTRMTSGASSTSKASDASQLKHASTGLFLTSSSSAIYSQSIVPVKRIDRSEAVAHMVAHPSLPFYFSATHFGQIRLWHFGLPHAIRSFADQSASLQRITRLRLSSTGVRLAATGVNGRVALWAIVPEHSEDAVGLVGYRSSLLQGGAAEQIPFQIIRAHSKTCHDCTFIQGASILITVGQSDDGRNLCVWDTLKGGSPLLYSIEVHASPSEASSAVGATSVCVLLDQSHRLVVGGANGAIAVVDLERRCVVQQISDAHGSSGADGSGGSAGAVTRLVYDARHKVLISACEERGEVKVWNPHAPAKQTTRSSRQTSSSSSFLSSTSTTMLELVDSFPSLYSRQRFFNLPTSSSGLFESHGLMDMMVTPQGHIVVCGSDGSVKYLRRKF
jgi:hypothetical protein